MNKSIKRYFTSLSTRLLLLTLIWVSFISVSIGYTMMLNWQLEASAAATRTITDMHYRAYRAALYAQPEYADGMFEAEIASFNKELGLLNTGDPWRPLVVPNEDGILALLAKVSERWEKSISPMLLDARKMHHAPNMGEINGYMRELTQLSDKIDDYRGYYLWQLRYLQMLLIILAIGSLFAIMILLWRWVIRPVSRLGEGIDRLSAGDLNARIQTGSQDEIGQIAVGFNHMAARLKDSYDNLEQKVAEKTASVEEKNSHLAQLYEMTSFFAQQPSLEELVEGFVTRIMDHTEADGCAVQLLDDRKEGVHLAATDGLPAELMEALEKERTQEDRLICTVLRKSYPTCFHLNECPDPFASVARDCGFSSIFCFRVRSTSGDIGIITLFFRQRPALTTQLVRLLETFASHLGVAIENSRLIERDRQFAVVQERQLLAQGLHDSIAQALSFLNLQVQFLTDAIKTHDDGLRDESLACIRTGVQECYEDVRELLLNFRERLHKESFIDGVRTVVKRFEAQAHVQTVVRVTGTGPELTPRQKLQVIFIIQEALSNVRKHAHANTVLLTIDNRDDLRVTIVDDGVGLDDKLVAERKGQHVGLSIMQERASRIGATVNVERAGPEGGTLVTLFLAHNERQNYA